MANVITRETISATTTSTSSPPVSSGARERMHNHSTPAPIGSGGVAAILLARRGARKTTAVPVHVSVRVSVPLRTQLPPNVTADSSPKTFPPPWPAEGAVTEIPEHLLKRSRERRAALGLSSDEGGGDAPATPAAAAPAASAAVEPAGASTPAVPPPPAPPAVVAPPPPPPPEYVQAAMRRKRIPYWALPVVALLPLWAFIYQWSLTPPSATISGPLAEGEAIYTANCASCHLPTGAGDSAGGIGRQLSNGEVLLTFPDIADQISFVMTGSDPYIGKPYGDPDRPGGPQIGKAGHAAVGGHPHRRGDQRGRLLRARSCSPVRILCPQAARPRVPPRRPKRPAEADGCVVRPPRGARGRRRSRGGGDRVLARVGRSRRPRRGEEDVPARKDLRRRAHSPRGAPAPRHGSRRTSRRLPPVRRPARPRPWHHARARVARASRSSRRSGTSFDGAISTRWSPRSR